MTVLESTPEQRSQQSVYFETLPVHRDFRMHLTSALGADVRGFFDSVVDRLLRVRREERAAWLADVKTGLATFPELEERDVRKLVREIVRYDIFNRFAFRFEMRFPGVAIFLARFVPIGGATRALKSVPPNRPIMLALTHFGPVHFVLTVLMPLLHGRQVYVLHAGGETSRAVAAYMSRVGAIPILNDKNSLRRLTAIVTQDPNSAIVYAFDFMAAQGRRPIMLLGKSVSIGRSVGHLADAGNAAVFTAMGDFSMSGVRVTVDGPYELDATKARPVRQDELMRRLYDVLENRLREAPAQWTEWYNCTRPSVAEECVLP